MKRQARRLGHRRQKREHGADHRFGNSLCRPRRAQSSPRHACGLLSSTVLQIIVSLCHYWKTFRPRGRA
ncbi:hypothetical protein BRL75_23525, partial [Xanthomonas oryzae pv. oryzae]